MPDNGSSLTSGDDYHRTSTWTIYKKCFRLILEQKRYASLMIGYGLLASASRAGIMFLLHGATSLAGTAVDWPLLVGYLALVLGAGIASYGFTFLARIKTQDVLREELISLISRACEVLCRSGYRPTDKTERLDLMLLLRQDVRAVRNISLSLMNIGLMGANVAAVLFSLFFISWQVAVVVPLVMLPITWHIARTDRKIIENSLNIRAHIIQNAGTTGKFIRALPMLRQFDDPDIGPSIITRMMRERLMIRLELAKLRQYTVFLSGVAGSLGITAMLALGLMTRTGVEFAGLVPALVGFFMVQQSIGSILQMNARNQEFIPIARHYFNRSEHWEKNITTEDGKIPLDAIRSITFEGTRFFDEEKQITPWNYSVETGRIYALIVRKAPVFDLLVTCMTRTQLPVEGKILINGVDYQQYSTATLARNVAFLSPNFPITIRENIRLGNRDLTEEGFERIVETFQLKELFANLDEGLETNLRQRIITLTPEQDAAIRAARLMANANASLFLIDMNDVRKLSDAHAGIFMDYLMSRKADAVIMLKPSVFDDLTRCDRIMRFKKFDFFMDGSRRDLEEETQRDAFFINPHPDVCVAREFSDDPKQWPTFERAVFGYRNLVQGLHEIYGDAVTDGDGVNARRGRDGMFSELEQEVEEEEEMELG